MGSGDLRPYVELIESFVEGRASAEEFERAYLTLFKNDATMWGEPEFGVLDRLFADVDAFCADPELRDAGDLDEGQLRQRGEVALRGLKALQGG